MNAAKVVKWVQENSDFNGFLEDSDLDKVAEKFGGEVVDTGGGIRVAIIPLGEGRIVGVGEEITCLYEDADKSKKPYDILWDNEGQILWPLGF